jgi:hypothetical protein
MSRRKKNMSSAEFDDWFQTRLEHQENGCMVWLGQTLAKGYGHVRIGNKKIQTHRYALSKKLGRPIGENMCALHTCDNPPCCNPDHLREGTNQDNVDDKMSKGREARNKGEKHGCAKLTESLVREIREQQGKVSQRKLAAKYDVSRALIFKILVGELWSHLN